MNPADYAKADTEHAHQVALFMWMSQQLPTCPELAWAFAIPNGGLRSKATAARLKAEGVKSGPSDILLPVARRGYSGFFIEMKKPKSTKGAAGKESKEQKDFGAFVHSQGYLYSCFDHWEKARDAIIWYMTKQV